MERFGLFAKNFGGSCRCIGGERACYLDFDFDVEFNGGEKGKLVRGRWFRIWTEMPLRCRSKVGRSAYLVLGRSLAATPDVSTTGQFNFSSDRAPIHPCKLYFLFSYKFRANNLFDHGITDLYIYILIYI